MRDGAVNYLAKPIDLDELLASVQRATGVTTAPSAKFSEDKQLPSNVIANSPLMQAVFHDASLIAPSESRVLITYGSNCGVRPRSM
jgi:DNA-binding NtrC family response regulator